MHFTTISIRSILFLKGSQLNTSTKIYRTINLKFSKDRDSSRNITQLKIFKTRTSLRDSRFDSKSLTMGGFRPFVPDSFFPNLCLCDILLYYTKFDRKSLGLETLLRSKALNNQKSKNSEKARSAGDEVVIETYCITIYIHDGLLRFISWSLW